MRLLKQEFEYMSTCGAWRQHHQEFELSTKFVTYYDNHFWPFWPILVAIEVPNL